MNVLLISLGTAGDVHPFAGVGVALKRRGHHAVLMVNEYFRPLADAAGLDFQAVGTREEFQEALRLPGLWDPYEGARILGRAMAEEMPAQYEAIVSRYVAGETLIVASGGCFGARIAQETHGAPLVTLILQPGAVRSAYRFPVLAGVPTIPDRVPVFIKRAMLRCLDPVLDRVFQIQAVNAFRKSLGLSPVRHLLKDWWLSPQRIIGMFPEWFGPRQPDWPRRLRLTGFPLYDGGAADIPVSHEADSFLNDGEPPIVFTPGSGNVQAQAFFDAAIDACQLLGRRAMLLTRFPEQLPRRLPAGVRHFDFLPFNRLLPCVAALVHHGGVGTTAQAMAAGIPQLVMPLAYDQPDNADRVKRLGVGDWLKPRAFRAEAVAKKLSQLLDSRGVASRCTSLAAQIRQTDAIEGSCDLIEDVMEKTPGAVTCAAMA